jgi:hypothetical protein
MQVPVQPEMQQRRSGLIGQPFEVKLAAFIVLLALVD